MPSTVGMCPHCGYLRKPSDAPRAPAGAMKYAGALVLILFIALFAALYATADTTEAEDLVPRSAAYVLSLDGALLSSPLFSGESPFGEDAAPMALLAEHADELLFFGVAGDGAESMAVVVRPRDREAFRDALAAAYGDASAGSYRGVDLYALDDSVRYYWSGPFCVLGDEPALSESIGASLGEVATLSGDTRYHDMRRALAAYPLAAYVSAVAAGEGSDALGFGEEMEGLECVGMGLDVSRGEMRMLMRFDSASNASGAAFLLNMFIGLAGEEGVALSRDGAVVSLLMTFPEGEGLEDLWDMGSFLGG